MFDQRQSGEVEPVVLDTGAGRLHRLLVTGEPVEEHTLDVTHGAEQGHLSPAHGALPGLLDDVGDDIRLPPPRGQHERGVLVRGVPGRGGDRVGLVDHAGRLGEVAVVDVHSARVDQGGGQCAERPDVAGQAHRAARQRVPGVQVPGVVDERLQGDRGQQQPPDGRLPGVELFVFEQVECLAQDRNAHLAAVREQRRHTVQEGVGGLGTRGRSPGRARRDGRGPGARRAVDAAREDGGADRLQVGLPGEGRARRGELCGRVQEQRCRLVAAAAGEEDPGPQPCQPGAVQGAQGIQVGHGREFGRPFRRGGREVGLRCRERAAPTRPGVGRHLHRAFQQDRLRGDAAALPSTVGGLFQPCGDLLVGPVGRLRGVPGTPVRVQERVGRVGQGPVHGAPVLGLRAVVDRRPDQGVPEPHRLAELDQACRLGRCGVRGDVEGRGRADQQARVTHRFRRGGQQQRARGGRQCAEPSGEVPLDAAGHRPLDARGARRVDPVGEFGGAAAAGELQQRQRVAVHLGHEPVPDPFLQPSPDSARQEFPGRGGFEALELQCRQAPQHGPSLGVADREGHRNRLREKSPGHELQCLQGHLVQPLGVVDQDEHRPGLRGAGEQGEYGEADQEAVGRIADRRPERHSQRVALGLRQFLDAVQERRAHLVQARVGQLHVGLDTARPGHRHPVRLCGRVLQKHRLADTRLAPDHENP